MIHHPLTGVAMTIARTAISPAYPPSFDNNPWLFGWALLSRSIVLILGLATIVRITSKTHAEKMPMNHPVWYYRTQNRLFIATAMLGGLSDVTTYLSWNEVSPAASVLIGSITKGIDGCTMFPLMLGLFVPVWVRALNRLGVIKFEGSLRLSGCVEDMRTTWSGAGMVPISLVLYCIASSLTITLVKWWVWYGHVGR